VNGQGITIAIQVSPNVLNIQSNGQVVTIHTDIAYSAVVGNSVSLNGVTISSYKADNRGFFVAKFLMDDIKDLFLNMDGLNTLTLVGETLVGETEVVLFEGTQEILVIDVGPKGK